MTGTLTMGAARLADREPAISDSLRLFTRVRGGTIRLVDGLTEEQAGYRPGPDAWSVAQILDHLLLTEALYRRQMKNLLDLAWEGKRSNIDVSLREVDLSLPLVPKALMPLMAAPLTVMNLFVPQALRETVLRFPIMKARNPKVSEPAPAKPLAVLRQQMAASLAETEALFAGALPAKAARVTVSHPVFGRNTIPNIFGLMAAHEERHGMQIADVLRQPGFPAGGVL